MRADPPLDAVAVGDQFGKGDCRRLIVTGVAIEVVNRRLDRRRNRLSGGAGEHQPVMVAGQRVIESAIVLRIERRKAVGRVAEDDVEADRLDSGLGQAVDQPGPDGAEEDARGGGQLFRVEAAAVHRDHCDRLAAGAWSHLVGGAATGRKTDHRPKFIVVPDARLAASANPSRRHYRYFAMAAPPRDGSVDMEYDERVGAPAPTATNPCSSGWALSLMLSLSR